MPLQEGARLGPYEISSPLGSGGMGEVYRARDTRLGRFVAVKVIAPNSAEDPERARRFAREAKVASSLTHPNVARLYDIGAEEGRNYLVMELVEGSSLEERLEGGPLSVEEVLGIGKAVASALMAAHERGIVHRDIKPANVMLTSSDEVKILDFGLAKLKPSFPLHKAETLTMSMAGSLVGTLCYMSPEQAVGGQIDSRSDLFSLGVLLFQAATGELPFRGDSAYELIDQIVHAEPTAPTILRSEIPSALEKVILRCMAKPAEQRFQSAEELLLALSDASIQRDESPRKPSILVLPFDDISPKGDNEYFSDGLTEEIITSLSKINSLAVVSRTSAMRLKGVEKDIRALGREMNVRHVLEGSVRKAGKALRITAQLIDTATDTHLWAETYKGSLEDIFEIQEEVATRITRALAGELSLDERVELTRRETSHPEAYDLCLQGRHRLTMGRTEDLLKAIELFDRAVELDPRYAAAHAGRAEAEASFFEFYDRDPQRLDIAMESALKALMYDPNLAEAFAALAIAHYNKGNLDEARRACQRSIELDPENYVGYWVLGRLHHVTGQKREAIGLLEKAIELKPDFYPGYFLLRMVIQALGEAWSDSPHLKRLVNEILPSYLERFPDDARALNCYGMELYQSGRVEESRAYAERALEVSPNDPLILYASACYYAYLDDKPTALDLLERAIEAGFRNQEYIACDPDLSNLHGERRYHDLLEQAGSPSG